MSAAKPTYTADDYAHAHRAALDITRQSTCVQSCITALIFTRQLFDATLRMLQIELQEGWSVDNPELVMRTMCDAALQKGHKPVSAQELHTTCIDTILPFTDALQEIQQEVQRSTAGDVPANQGTENGEANAVDPPAAV